MIFNNGDQCWQYEKCFASNSQSICTIAIAGVTAVIAIRDARHACCCTFMFKSNRLKYPMNKSKLY